MPRGLGVPFIDVSVGRAAYLRWLENRNPSRSSANVADDYDRVRPCIPHTAWSMTFWLIGASLPSVTSRVAGVGAGRCWPTEASRRRALPSFAVEPDDGHGRRPCPRVLLVSGMFRLVPSASQNFFPLRLGFLGCCSAPRRWLDSTSPAVVWPWMRFLAERAAHWRQAVSGNTSDRRPSLRTSNAAPYSLSARSSVVVVRDEPRLPESVCGTMAGRLVWAGRVSRDLLSRPTVSAALCRKPTTWLDPPRSQFGCGRCRPDVWILQN